MDEPDCAEPVAEGGFGTILQSQRTTDQISGDRQHHNRKGVDPVIKPDRQLPDIHTHNVLHTGLPSERADLVNIPPLLVIEMDRTRDTGVERVNCPEDFQRLVGVLDRRPDQRCLVRRHLSLRITRRCVPGARHHELVIVDLLVLDDNPVRQRSTRGFRQPYASCFRSAMFPDPISLL